VLIKDKEYGEAALRWLIDDGIASKVVVRTFSHALAYGQCRCRYTALTLLWRLINLNNSGGISDGI
jgi:hypothetical protein